MPTTKNSKDFLDWMEQEIGDRDFHYLATHPGEGLFCFSAEPEDREGEFFYVWHKGKVLYEGYSELDAQIQLKRALKGEK